MGEKEQGREGKLRSVAKRIDSWTGAEADGNTALLPRGRRKSANDHRRHPHHQNPAHLEQL